MFIFLFKLDGKTKYLVRKSCAQLVGTSYKLVLTVGLFPEGKKNVRPNCNRLSNSNRTCSLWILHNQKTLSSALTLRQVWEKRPRRQNYHNCFLLSHFSHKLKPVTSSEPVNLLRSCDACGRPLGSGSYSWYLSVLVCKIPFQHVRITVEPSN